jgi:hypothetical protein
VFTPKDQMGDWLEFYAGIMELDYWASAECLNASYDPAQREWAVLVERGREQLVLRPKQLVFATGSYGPPNELDLPAPDASPACNITQAGTSAALRLPARNASSSAPTRRRTTCAPISGSTTPM